MSVICLKCGAELTPGAKFCRRCGTKVTEARCAKCGAPLSPGAGFCGKCGAEVGKPKISETPGAGRSICEFCGRTLDPGAKVCKYCGAKAPESQENKNGAQHAVRNSVPHATQDVTQNATQNATRHAVRHDGRRIAPARGAEPRKQATAGLVNKGINVCLCVICALLIIATIVILPRKLEDRAPAASPFVDPGERDEYLPEGVVRATPDPEPEGWVFEPKHPVFGWFNSEEAEEEGQK